MSLFTERASERVAHAEQAVLPPTPALAQPAATRGARRNNALALGMIVTGMAMLLGRPLVDSDALTGGMILLTLASGFLFWGFWRRIYGLLIPGALLAGLSVGISFAELSGGVSVIWGLAAGFGAIGLLGHLLFGRAGRRGGWAFVPATVLLLSGAIVAMLQRPGLLSLGVLGVPLLLIGAGLYLGSPRRPA